MPNLKINDGTSRKPRKVQVDLLTWLEVNWDKADVFAITAPVALGKSFVARTIQRATGGAVMPPSNLLMDQYLSTYPEVNALKGATHYECGDIAELTCADRKALKMKPCQACPYRKARREALECKPTFFNPMSFYYLQQDQNYERPKVLVIDEAHSLLGMASMLTGKKLRISQWGQPKALDQLSVERWLRDKYRTLASLAGQYEKQGRFADFAKATKDADSIKMSLDGLEAEPENYEFYIEAQPYRNKVEDYFCMQPIKPPLPIVRQLMDADKVILLSATLLEHDLASLTEGRRTLKYDAPSPIPVANRPILYKPTPFPVNFKTDPADLAAHIVKVLADYPGQNTIIHASYSLAKKLAPYLAPHLPLLTHTAETKDKALEEFKRTGGVLLASGMSEGIDLAGDLCRVNLIPALQRTNRAEPAVSKRLAMSDGATWYDLETLKTVIQQAGRSTRHEKDYSVTIVCDPQFADLVPRRAKLLPGSFVESISWRSSSKSKVSR